MKRGLVVGSGIVLTVLLVAWVISCGGGGSGKKSDFSGFNVTLDVGPKGQNIPLVADTTWSVANSVRYDVGLFGGPFTSLVLDLEDNLPGLTFSTLAAGAGLNAKADPLGLQSGTMTIHIAPVDAADPCTEGETYGPFVITLDVSNQPESVDPSTLIASQSTIDIINVGAFSICVEIYSPVDANVSQDEVGFTVCDESIADIAGTWVGDYSCGGNCPESGEVTLWITQAAGNPGYANYTDDGGAFYSGTVCGYTFSFDGGTDFYDENGIFTMNPDGLTATKTSRYADRLPGTCSGSCLDTLSRLVAE